ncbi:MAG TPA: DUF4160 domain-containing protein [Flavilitoribacter sp.]|nr:DUF4160 domain-containing protein [Flavilitoribacter sp.]HMQ90068.1 DUF4160 domain-containing protein [Flavilitoribacter sp.]
MPTVLNISGFRFFFYSNEGNEPPHIHVEKGDGYGKYWLEPLEKDYMKNFSPRDERKVDEIMQEQKVNFLNIWYDYFG